MEPAQAFPAPRVPWTPAAPVDGCMPMPNSGSVIASRSAKTPSVRARWSDARERDLEKANR